jgi:hypothetical protein
MVQEYDASVRELGERVKRLERDVMQADDAISDAISRRVGQEAEGGGTQVITIPRIPAIPAIPAIPQIGFPGQIGRRDLTEVHQRYQKMMVAEAAGLILLGALVCRYVWHRAMRKASRLGAAGGDILGLRQSVDAIAVEVERISENQRYVTKVLNRAEGEVSERAKSTLHAQLNDKSLGAGEAQRIGAERVGADPIPRRG